MTTQPEALRLSLRLEQLANLEANELAEVMGAAATELCRLHEMNQELLKELQSLLAIANKYPDLRERNGSTIFNAHAAIAKATGGEA